MISRAFASSSRSVRPTSSKLCIRQPAYSTSNSPGPNEGIIKLLTHNIQEESSLENRNAYKIRSFQTAINVIKTLDYPLTSGKEAEKLRGIGPKISARIDAFINGKVYDEGPKTQAKVLKKTKAASLFQTVPGVGEATAMKLVNAGCSSTNDMRKPQYFDILTPAQKVGLTYIDHLDMPVTREQSESVADFIRDHISSKFEIVHSGSYRRKALTSSDIDILLFHPSYVHIPFPNVLPPDPSTINSTSVGPSSFTRGNAPVPFRSTSHTKEQRLASPLLMDVVRPLEDSGLLAATLSGGPRKWQGVTIIPGRMNGRVNGNGNGKGKEVVMEHGNGGQEGMEGLTGGNGHGNGSVAFDVDDGNKWQNTGQRLRDIRATRGVYRRLDLNLAPMGSRGAALLALTGDVDFVRTCRINAIKLGMHLNEFGLWRWNDSASPPPLPELVRRNSKYAKEREQRHKEEAERRKNVRGWWELVEGESEEGILRELGMGWVPPEKRNFRFLTSR